MEDGNHSVTSAVTTIASRERGLTRIIYFMIIDGIEYVPKSKQIMDISYVIVRTFSAGVFAGYLTERSKDGKRGKVLNARRLFYWDGAASLSQLSQEGVKKPENCKFPCEVPFVELSEIIEVLPCTEEAKESIAGVKIWKM